MITYVMSTKNNLKQKPNFNKLSWAPISYRHAVRDLNFQRFAEEFELVFEIRNQ